jgi:tRNA threonylcarbamoyladenosine biosynthesis protein TsaE
MLKEIITHSEQETRTWAQDLASGSEKGSVFLLHGDLGTGKTIIAKGIAKGLGIDEEITSPTFLMLEIYESGRLPMYHFDLYRIDDPGELDELGFEEYWEGAGISVVEWPEKAGDRIPEKAIKIHIQWQSENERRITIEYPGN